MVSAMTIRPVALPLTGFEVLLAEARSERVAFLDRMKAEWETGANRFSQPGEVLLGAFDGDQLLGVCGLNIDPYEDDPAMGRLRHLFVAQAGRGRGTGKALVEAILKHARGRFSAVRLRTDPDIRGSFYESLGFHVISKPQATHEIVLDE